jgi:hypothetical protein
MACAAEDSSSASRASHTLDIGVKSLAFSIVTLHGGHVS